MEKIYEEYFDKATKRGSKPGLENIDRLTEYFGHPENSVKYIHIAGTNGKGSVSAYLTSILSMAGLKVGRFNSPEVFDKYEMLGINKENIDKSEYEELMCRVIDACMELEKEDIYITSFEIKTAMAFLYFFEKNVDYGIIETGMGGRLDSTNIIKNPKICILTSIDYDHMQFLGDTLEKIAKEKAGIITGDSVVFAGKNKEEVIKSY